MKINVPIRVTLAEKKMPIDAIDDLAPGMILEFKKSCGDPLTLEVGDCKVAEGEAIRVGEKFGLLVTSMRLPEEQFYRVRGNREADVRKGS